MDAPGNAQTARDRYHIFAVDFPLTAEVMAADGFHPGASGYAQWAQQVARLIRDTQRARG